MAQTPEATCRVPIKNRLIYTRDYGFVKVKIYEVEEEGTSYHWNEN